LFDEILKLLIRINIWLVKNLYPK